MLIKNRQKDALLSTLTPDELGKAMSQLDLSTVPDHKRAQAIKDHFMRVVADSILDKQRSFEIHASRLLRQRMGG